MYINIIRGQQQIGGSIVEIGTDTTNIIFDVGVNLVENENVEVPNVDGLFCGAKKYDAVFISHYHADHIGLLGNVIPNIPIYIGAKAYKIVRAANEYRELETPFTPIYVTHKEKITIKDITITPILCDHSAFDSYMYLIEADGKKVLYTGDFRANGRFDYDVLLSELPKVDSLIIEGTTLSREEEIENIEEEYLEEIALNALKRHNGPAFIMMSAMNVDRLRTAYNVAVKSKRFLLEDIYTAMIAEASEVSDINPQENNDIKVFMTGGDKQFELLSQFENNKIGKYAIAKLPFLMTIRPSMRNYLDKLNEICSFENGILFYGMWKGYLERPDMKEFISFMESKGIKLHILHTSGHADVQTIDKLVDVSNPNEIIPIHTENDKWFSRYESRTILYECVNHKIV